MALCCFYYVIVWTLQFDFIVLLGLVFMSRRKCEAIACLFSQVKCDFLRTFILCTLFVADKFDLISFDLLTDAWQGFVGIDDGSWQSRWVATILVALADTIQFTAVAEGSALWQPNITHMFSTPTRCETDRYYVVLFFFFTASTA